MSERKKRGDVWNLTSILILALYGLFLIYPLVRLLVESVTKDGNFTTAITGKPCFIPSCSPLPRRWYPWRWASPWRISTTSMRSRGAT